MKRTALVVGVAMIASLLLVPASGSFAATASTHAQAHATYHARLHHIRRSAYLRHGFSVVRESRSHAALGGRARLSAFRSPGGSTPAASVSGTSAISASANSTLSVNKNGGSSVVQSFNGLSDTSNDALNGFELSPPDQGLCVGWDYTLPHHPHAVWEPINETAERRPRTERCCGRT